MAAEPMTMSGEYAVEPLLSPLSQNAPELNEVGMDQKGGNSSSMMDGLVDDDEQEYEGENQYVSQASVISGGSSHRTSSQQKVMKTTVVKETKIVEQETHQVKSVPVLDLKQTKMQGGSMSVSAQP